MSATEHTINEEFTEAESIAISITLGNFTDAREALFQGKTQQQVAVLVLDTSLALSYISGMELIEALSKVQRVVLS